MYATTRTITACILSLALCGTACAADWRLKDKEGVRYTLSSLKGKWVLVNFWAPWCPPCLEEMPGFSALQKRHPDLQVIGVAIMYRKKSEVLNVARQQALPYPIVLGDEDTAAQFGGIEALPTSYLYTPAGKLLTQRQGPFTQREIERLMHEAGSGQ